MGLELSSETIARLKARAAAADDRSDSASMAADSVEIGDVMRGMPQSDDPAVREYLEGMNTPFAGMISNMVAGDGSQAKGLFGALGRMLGGQSMFMSMGGQTVSLGAKRKARAAPPPATEADVAAAEQKLGFALPQPLRALYLEVANGGIGPGDGLYSLKQLVAKWREMTDEPIGPRGQKWPKNLLPIEGDRWDFTCIDRDSGKLFIFDIEEIDHGGWKKCFQETSDSLDAWLGEWLAKPTAAEQAARRAERPEPKQLTDEDFKAWEEDHPEFAEYQRRVKAFTMTPEERAAIGLPEKDWESKVFEGLDLSKIKHPTPGYAERRKRGEKHR